VSAAVTNSVVQSVTLVRAGGLRVDILDKGATLQNIFVPTPRGPVNVLLNYPNKDDYARDPFFLGAIVGRYANRIRDARFKLHGRSVRLDANEEQSGHCLHGGERGFFAQRFALAASADGRAVECRYVSPHGDQGFPGRVDVLVTYSLLTDFSLGIDFVARAHSDTVLNLANHAYFNLDGRQRSIDGHMLKLHADFYTPADASGVPSGEIRSVAASKFDLRSGVSLANQFDHNFVLRDAGGELRDAAELYSADSGIRLCVRTTQPGLQLYTGDSLRTPFLPREGVCLEAQNYPDAPNQPGFPSAILAAGETYRQQTVYDFAAPEEP
jgi:aldose 1-epimerase